MDKVTLDVKDGKATITEGGDTFLGRLLAGRKGKIKISKLQPNHRRLTGEFEIAQPSKRKKK